MNLVFFADLGVFARNQFLRFQVDVSRKDAKIRRDAKKSEC
jgi:hypothetical protein